MSGSHCAYLRVFFFFFPECSFNGLFSPPCSLGLPPCTVSKKLRGFGKGSSMGEEGEVSSCRRLFSVHNTGEG